MTWKSRLIIYPMLALILLLCYQLAMSWIKGQEWSPWISAYRPLQSHQRPAKALSPPKAASPITREIQGFIEPPSASQPNPQFTIGRWEIPDCPPQGVVVEVKATEDGKPYATYEPIKMGFVEIGKLRELSVYVEKGWELQEGLSNSLEVGAEYRHDLFRVGPVWLQGGGRAGWEKITLPNGLQVQGAKVAINARLAWRF